MNYMVKYSFSWWGPVSTARPTVFILDAVLEELLRHANVSPREVRIVGHALWHLHSSRGVIVTRKQRKYVVL